MSLDFSDFLHDVRKSVVLLCDHVHCVQKNLIRQFLAIMADFWPIVAASDLTYQISLKLYHYSCVLFCALPVGTLT